MTLWTPTVIGGVHSVGRHLSTEQTVSREGMGYKLAEAAVAAPRKAAVEAAPMPAAAERPNQPDRAAAGPTGPR